MSLKIHENIKQKLDYFHEIHKIPNILFHGPPGSGKRTLVKEFIQLIYNDDRDKIKSFVMYVNCAHGKGIKFIREEFKFFAKTHIQSNGGNFFKTIVLLNADKLTMDAQSAMRRCIELFSHSTRFFIIVEDKYKILKPILSRFCDIYVPSPIHLGKPTNLYTYNINETFSLKTMKSQHIEGLKREINLFLQKKDNLTINTKTNTKSSQDNTVEFAEKLYENGYSGLDLMYVIENSDILLQELNMSIEQKYECLIMFQKVSKEIKNEKMFLFFILGKLGLRP